MRVAVVASETNRTSDRSGVARTTALAEALAACGHEVRVFCTQWWDGYDTVRERNGVPFQAVTVAPADTSFTARIAFLIAAFRPDAVHATLIPPTAVLAARVGATLARATFVLDWYGDEPVADSRWLGLAARAPDRVLCPSEFVASRIQSLGVSAETTTVLPEFVSFETVRATEPAMDAPDIVAARRLDAEANLESLFLALAELRDRDWSAVVVGDGPARERYEQQVADLRIEGRVEFVGSQSRHERVALYRGARVFAHTATREEFPTELLWGLACGCAGVVEYQKESAAHELVERRERGFRATTPEEVEDALVEAGNLPESTVDDSFAEFDRSAIVDDLLDHYRGSGAST